MTVTPRFVSVKEIRQISGITLGEIDDDDISDMIFRKEEEIENRLNTVLSPQIFIDRQDGTNRNTIYTKKSPLLSLRSITNQDTSLTIQNLRFERSGRIRMGLNATSRTFSTFPLIQDSVVIEYYVGDIEFPTSGGISTTSNAASTAGTTVALGTASTAGFKVGDWVEVFGTDGFKEAALVTAISVDTSITVDNLRYTHVSGSHIRKLVPNRSITEYIMLEVALMLFGREVGQSFDDITGYTLTEFQVQKGEPFTQWREAYRQNIERWKTLKKTVRARVSIRTR